MSEEILINFTPMETRVALVDIGLERTGFIHVSDIVAIDNRCREDKSRHSENISDHIAVSQLIEDPLERERLLRLLVVGLAAENMDEVGGFILLTAAEGVGPEEITADLRFLKHLWVAVSRRARTYEKNTLMVLATQAVVDRLVSEVSAHLADLEKFIGKTINLRAESSYGQEHFDILLL